MSQKGASCIGEDSKNTVRVVSSGPSGYVPKVVRSDRDYSQVVSGMRDGWVLMPGGLNRDKESSIHSASIFVDGNVKPEEESLETKGVQERSGNGTGPRMGLSPLVSVKSLLGLNMKGMLGNGRGKRGMAYMRTKLHLGVLFATSATQPKWLCQIGGVTGFDVNQIQNSVEWTSFNTVFEEFFVHSMGLQYEPVNQFTTGMQSGTGNLEDSGVVIAGYQHNQPAIAETNHSWTDMMNSSQSVYKNTSRPFKFTWKNVEKFAKDGTAGDATTSVNTQAWLNIGSVAKLGGFVTAALPFATAAAAAANAYAINTNFGSIIVTWDVSFRYRD